MCCLKQTHDLLAEALEILDSIGVINLRLTVVKILRQTNSLRTYRNTIWEVLTELFAFLWKSHCHSCLQPLKWKWKWKSYYYQCCFVHHKWKWKSYSHCCLLALKWFEIETFVLYSRGVDCDGRSTQFFCWIFSGD